MSSVFSLFSFNLRVFTSKSGKQCRHYTFYMWSLLFVRDQKLLDNLLISCSVARYVLLPHYITYKKADKWSRISSMAFAFGVSEVSVNSQYEVSKASHH